MKTQVEDKKETVLDEYFSPFTIFLVVFFFTALCFVFLILDVIHRTAYYDLSCLILTIPAILIIVLRFKNSNVVYKTLLGMCFGIDCLVIVSVIWYALKEIL